ncbi:MAG TPA: sigma-54 dependent transcriptional regulator [bacterium]|nr:sigma-54 dependent transcriptional regulator [bacterium]HPN29611.1 sigma-54 dependent transcriptional regulator [bacterium]
MLKILTISEQGNKSEIFQVLIENKYSVKYSNDYEEAAAYINSGEFDVVFLDFKFGNKKVFDLLKIIKLDSPKSRAIVITDDSTVPDAVQAMKLGAYDYILKPVENDKLIRLVEEAEFYSADNAELIKPDIIFDNIIGKNKSLKTILKKVKLIANTKVSVLITGENGTGKELIAEATHNLSERYKKSFITVNCAAIPANLIESELFGFEKGAFTGAVKSQTGKFEAANDGTLFIDEIGDMDVSVQAKLLRVIENREIFRLGSNNPVKINTRFIFATNKNLREEVKQGRFREDLYYRINVVNLELPPLRNRREDIPSLFKYYFNLFCKEYSKQINNIEPEVLKVISIYYWPGNIRQFKNVIENMVVLNENGVIKYADLPYEIRSEYNKEFEERGKEVSVSKSALPHFTNISEDRKILTLAEIEKNAILETLRMTNFNKTKTAQILNVSLRTIQRKIKDYGLE